MKHFKNHLYRTFAKTLFPSDVNVLSKCLIFFFHIYMKEFEIHHQYIQQLDDSTLYIFKIITEASLPKLRDI